MSKTLLRAFAAGALICATACSDEQGGHVAPTDGGAADTGVPGVTDGTARADAPDGLGSDASGRLGDAASHGDAASGDASGECAGPLKGFLCPCTETSDCQSGFCVDSAQGAVCTQECLTAECPDGFSCKGVLNLWPDVVFICVPDALRLCAPCQADEQCGSGRCLPIAGGSFCTQPCSSVTCAPGYICAEDPAAAALGLGPVCLPDTGSCDCTKDKEGATRPCSRAADDLTCWGVETCDPLQGWIGCSAQDPAPEVCNGVDDDCNGTVDDGIAIGEPCVREVEGVGACPGVTVCLGVNGALCNAPDPGPELCNFKDDDCDGETDEGFLAGGVYATAEHCGTCNKSCAQAGVNGTAVCDASKDPPQCVVESCDEGFFKLNEYQCIPVTTSLCQPCAKDTDCFLDGARCMPLGDGKYCGKACAGADDCPFGYACEAFDGGQQCRPVSGTCSCDGSNPDLKKSCSLTWVNPTDPSAPATTCLGIQSCGPTGWEPCALPDDVCDGKDNDCDGLADEGFIDAKGRYVTDQHCGACDNNCAALPVEHAVGVCDSSPETPACALDCEDGWVDVDGNPVGGCECEVKAGPDVPDGVDSDCDGVDGEIQNAVFVAKNGADAAVGSKVAPVLTVQRGIDRAVELGLRDVYVATGVYQGSILLATGIGVYGGYSSDFVVRDRVLYETVLMGIEGAVAGPGTVNVVNPGLGAGPTALDGFTVFGPDTAVPGKSSYGIVLRNAHEGVVVSNCTIIAGDGGDGLPGSAGTSGGDGIAGTAGLAATEFVECAGKNNAGGAAGIRTCGAIDVSGGGGGTSVCPDYDDSGSQPYSPPITQAPAPGEAGASGHGVTSATGGTPGWDFLKWSAQVCANCISPPPPNTWAGADGEDGAIGEDGTGGVGCTDTLGKILAGEWVPYQPTGGGPGTHGAGGGGGGAGGGVELSACGDGGTDLGGSGGGGGSGGCSGGAGASATSGGGSFAVFMTWSGTATSTPMLTGNLIRSGSGGNGGAGGQGGVGGSGGAGASGGASGAANPTTLCAGQGGHGGSGGGGGHGGGGGGGCGGPSYGLFAAGQGGLDLSGLKGQGNVFEAGGTGGLGGVGGASLGQPGGEGAFGPTGFANF